MEPVSYNYDSDDHSQDYQSDNEGSVREKLANIKVERKLTYPKKVDENQIERTKSPYLTIFPMYAIVSGSLESA
jgi:hypothetical protein